MSHLGARRERVSVLFVVDGPTQSTPGGWRTSPCIYASSPRAHRQIGSGRGLTQGSTTAAWSCV